MLVVHWEACSEKRWRYETEREEDGVLMNRPSKYDAGFIYFVSLSIRSIGKNKFIRARNQEQNASHKSTTSLSKQCLSIDAFRIALKDLHACNKRQCLSRTILCGLRSIQSAADTTLALRFSRRYLNAEI